MDRQARHLCASMLLALGTAPLAGCGAALSDGATTAQHAESAPALLDLSTLASGEVRRIDASPVVPVRFGQRASSADPAAPVIDFGSAEMVASPSAPAVVATVPQSETTDGAQLEAGPLLRQAADGADAETERPRPLAELTRLPSDDNQPGQIVAPAESTGTAATCSDEDGGYEIEPRQSMPVDRMAVEALPTIEPDDSILPVEEAAAQPVEQTELPWARAMVNNEALVPVLMQADAFTRRAFELADRGAYFSARSEFTGGLRLVAQAMDVQQQTTLYTRSLTAGLTALKEADDFTPQAQRGQLALQHIVAGHSTPVLKSESLEGVSPLVARQRYLGFAKEQLSAASGALPACSLAMFGMGKIAMQSAPRDPASQLAATGKAMVWHQAALQADARNFRSANELGVLLAKSGDAAGARSLFEQSLSVSPQPLVWANLSAVQERLGNKELAAQARQQAELASRSGSAPGLAASIRWVDPATFARTSGGDAAMPPAPSTKQTPAATAAVPKPPKKSASSWNLWNGSSRR